MHLETPMQLRFDKTDGISKHPSTHKTIQGFLYPIFTEAKIFPHFALFQLAPKWSLLHFRII